MYTHTHTYILPPIHNTISIQSHDVHIHALIHNIYVYITGRFNTTVILGFEADDGDIYEVELPRTTAKETAQTKQMSRKTFQVSIYIYICMYI